MSELQPADGATLPSYGWDRPAGADYYRRTESRQELLPANFGIGGPFNCTRGGEGTWDWVDTGTMIHVPPNGPWLAPV